MAHAPTSTAKLKSRDYANKMRYGSPKLQTMLREKCRQRMREKRDQLFNKHRFSLELESEHTQDTLTEIIRQELKDLMTSDWDKDAHFTINEINEPLTQEEAIELENKIIQEQEQWILEEYEKYSRDEIESLARYVDIEGIEVFCPICQREILREENHYVACVNCGLRLIGRTIKEIKYLINESVNTHAFTCTKVPMFITIPDNNDINLYVICHDCSTLALIC